MLGFKRSPLETDRLYELGLLADPERRSFLSLNGHLVLYGIDKSRQRENIHAKAKGECEICKKPAASLGGYENWAGEWHHIETEVGKHCDCLHNGSWRCHGCHAKAHAHRSPRFGEAKARALEG